MREMDYYIIGTLIATASLSLPLNFFPSDGRCLAIAEYPKLASVLHDGDNWPYGRCMYNYGFKLPNTCDKNNNCMLIKVK